MIDKENIIRNLEAASIFLQNKSEREPDTYDEHDVEAFLDISLICATAKTMLENSIVLPCPIGSTIYRVYSRTLCNGKTKVIGKILRTKLTWNNLSRVIEGYGTKYFRTRADAELSAKGE